MSYGADKLKMGVILDFNVTFDLEGQGPNLVILAWMGPELSREQASDWHTDWQTHRRRQRQYPRAKTGLG